MTDTQPSGIDMARAALASARAAAKTRPAESPRRRRVSRSSIRRAGDPLGLGSAVTRMMTERGWEPPEAGGSIIDQWPTIAPELADKVTAERYEHDTATLHLRPASDAYATQLRLRQAQVLARIQQNPTGASVRSLKILPAGGGLRRQDPAVAAEAATAPEAAGQVRTREDGCTGYQTVRQLLLENKLPPPAPIPYLAEADQRQIAALRAGRRPVRDRTGDTW